MRELIPALILSSVVFALPTDPSVLNGAVEIQRDSKELQIFCSDRSVLQWSEFDIGPKETLFFTLPAGDSAVLNQLQSISQIDGSLYSNGRVYFSAPNGLIIGNDAVIDVNSLLISSLEIDAAAFIQGRDISLTYSGGAPLIQKGQIIAREGNIFLLGPSVDNRGSLQAQEEVSLISCSGALIQADGKGILFIQPELSFGHATNTGTIEALKVRFEAHGSGLGVRHLEQGAILSSSKDGKIYLNAPHSQIDLSGSVQGEKIHLDSQAIGLSPTGSLEGSKILLEASQHYLGGTIQGEEVSIQTKENDLGLIHLLGSVDAESSISVKGIEIVHHGSLSAKNISVETKGSYVGVSRASTKASQEIHFLGSAEGSFFSSETIASQNGGKIEILAGDIRLAGAKISSTGELGGSIAIGSVDLTQNIISTATTVLSADGSQEGGSIALISAGSTKSYGAITADGTLRGGKIEISGSSLGFSQNNRLSAKGAIAGEILFDPKNIIIADPSTGQYPQFELIDPTPSQGTGFGTIVEVFSNGNFLVTKPNYAVGADTNVGAVYLYSSAGELLTTLTGTVASSLVGQNVEVFGDNSGAIVLSTAWRPTTSAGERTGAITWVLEDTGVSGTVSATNSLVGTQTGEGQPAGLPNYFYEDLYNGKFLLKIDNRALTPGSGFDFGFFVLGDPAVPVFGTVSLLNVFAGTGLILSTTPSLELPNGNLAIDQGRVPSGFQTGSLFAKVIDPNQPLVGSVSDRSAVISSNFSPIGKNAAVLTTGHVVYASSTFSLPTVSTVGCAIWMNSDGSTVGTVSERNALIGSFTNDRISSPFGLSGTSNLFTLPNGNYVIPSGQWGLSEEGAVTVGNGLTGTTGTVSAQNSLIGTNINNAPASTYPSPIVVSAVDSTFICLNSSGVTWIDGSVGLTGTLSDRNSLITNQSGLGSSSAVALSDGNFAARTNFTIPGGPASVGAVVWIDGTTGLTGTITTLNSIHGSSTLDAIGFSGTSTLLALDNGQFVFTSSNWDVPGGRADVGAITFVDTPFVGTVSALNSLIGSSTSDQVGSGFAVLLDNGGAVVRSPLWDFSASALDAGAVTQIDPLVGTAGTISALNSLVGSSSSDSVGSTSITLLDNGNYVIANSSWSVPGGALDVGAVTWVDATVGITGTISARNSLIGSSASDAIGGDGITLLDNGNYVVTSTDWDAPDGTQDVGAVTWASMSTGVTGTVSYLNSLIGSSASDSVGSGGITALSNNNYVVRSPLWDNELGISNVGAVTLGSGSTGVTGTISDLNSIRGSTANSQVSSTAINESSDGTFFLVLSESWHQDSLFTEQGAITWVSSTTGRDEFGFFSEATTGNSLVGFSSNAGLSSSTPIDTTREIFVGSFTGDTEGDRNGRVAVGLYNISSITFDIGAASDMFLSPDFLLGILNQGSDLTLQANNDVTIDSDVIVNNAGGAGGALTISAGRSVTVNATVTTDDGNITLQANDPAAIALYRDAGDGDITISSTGEINVGAGAMVLQILGTTDSGSITLEDGALLTASSGSILLDGGVDITLQESVTAQIQTTGSASVTLQPNNDITISAPITFSNGGNGGDLTLSAGRSVEIDSAITTDGGDLFVYSNDPTAEASLRGAGDGNISLSSSADISTGTGNVTMQTLGTTDSGSILLSRGSNLEASDGDILLISAVDIRTVEISSASIATTGTGNLTLVVDNKFPTSPSVGPGIFDIGLLSLSAGGELQLYASAFGVSTFPSTINGVAYIAGSSPYESGPVYYDSGVGGTPFMVFYKTDAAPTPSLTPSEITRTRQGRFFLWSVNEEAFSLWTSSSYGGVAGFNLYAPYGSIYLFEWLFPRMVDILKEQALINEKITEAQKKYRKTFRKKS